MTTSEMLTFDDLAVAYQLAGKPEDMPPVANLLKGASDEAVVEFLPELSEGVLAELARSRAKRDIRLLPLLGRVDNEVVQRAVWRNKATSTETRSFIEDHGLETRQMRASAPCAPQSVLSELAGDPALSVRTRVARNPRASVEILTRLLEEDSVIIWEALAENPSLPKTLWETLAERVGCGSEPRDDATLSLLFGVLPHTEFAQVRLALLRHKSVPQSWLERWASEPHRDLRCAVARHPQVTVDILERLSGDDDVVVLFWVLQSPNVTSDLIRIICTSDAAMDLGGMTNFHRVPFPLEVLTTLYWTLVGWCGRCPTHNLVEALCDREDTPTDVLADIAERDERDFMLAMNHPNAPELSEGTFLYTVRASRF